MAGDATNPAKVRVLRGAVEYLRVICPGTEASTSGTPPFSHGGNRRWWAKGKKTRFLLTSIRMKTFLHHLARVMTSL